MAGRSYDPLVRMSKREVRVDDAMILKVASAQLEEMIRYGIRVKQLKFDIHPNERGRSDDPGMSIQTADTPLIRMYKIACDGMHRMKDAQDEDKTLTYFDKAMRAAVQLEESAYKVAAIVASMASHQQRKIEHSDAMALKSGKKPDEMTDAEIDRIINGRPGTDGEAVVINDSH